MRAALCGAAAAFVAMSLFEAAFFYFDLCRLSTLLTVAGGELPVSDLVWLPALCAVIGFVAGPALAASPASKASPRTPGRPSRSGAWGLKSLIRRYSPTLARRALAVNRVAP